jgi:hypothetical protein
MEKQTCKGVIKDFSKDGVLIDLDIDGIKQERLQLCVRFCPSQN